MTTLAVLEARLTRLKQTHFPPRLYVFIVEAGDDLTPEQRRQIRPGDRVVIEEIPRGYFGAPLSSLKAQS